MVIVIVCIQGDHAGVNLCIFLEIYASETQDAQVDGSLQRTWFSVWLSPQALTFQWLPSQLPDF